MNFKNSRKQGDWGMGVAIAYFTSKGYTTLIPLTDSQEYDLVFEDQNKELKKVQVKTSTREIREGVFAVQLKTCGGNKSNNKVKHFESFTSDFIFIVTQTGSWLIPSWKIEATDGIVVGNKWEEYRVRSVSGSIPDCNSAGEGSSPS